MTDDVWIEVNEMCEGLQPFYGHTTAMRPIFPIQANSPVTLVVKFNLTAYVRHMIEEADKSASEPTQPIDFNVK